MKYMTVREAAEKWQISSRRVQQYCLDERIEGAKKVGAFWLIPDDTLKPNDPRQEKGQNDGFLIFGTLVDSDLLMMPLMNTPFKPGSCLDVLNAMTDGPQKDIAWAEYYYFSGQAEDAIQVARKYLNSTEASLRLSAC